MSDNEEATAALGDSEELSVKHSPCEMIPALGQRPDECPEVPSAVSRKSSGDIFPDDPHRENFRNNADKVHGQSATFIGKPTAFSCDAESLAGSPADHNVNCSKVPPLKLCHVAIVRHGRKAMRQNGGRKLLNFAEADRFPAKRPPCHAGGLDARTQGQIPQTTHGRHTSIA